MADESHGGLSVATIKRVESSIPVYLDTARRFAGLLEVSLVDLALGSDPKTSVADACDIESAPATVAVMPFEVIGAGPYSRCFADGLVEELIVRMGRDWFPVISRSSTFHYRGTGAEPKRLRLELGVDYVIEGSIQRSGSTIRVSIRLTDAKTAVQLWADVYDRPYEDVFALQNILVSAVLAQVGGIILDTEVQRRFGHERLDLTAWELSLRASWFSRRRTKAANAEARSLFEEALRRERALPRAWFGLAMTHQRAIVNQWSSDVTQSIHEMRNICLDYRREHPSDPGLPLVFAYTDVYRGDRNSALSRLRESIEIDPNATTAYCLYGQALAMDSRSDEAIEQFELAMRLSPRDTERWRVRGAVALCHFVTSRYEDMLQSAKAGLEAQPDMPFLYGTLAVAHVCLGNIDDARAAVQAMLALEPATSARGLSAIVAAVSPDIVDRYVVALQRAGVPG